jgi:hypothetical protein
MTDRSRRRPWLAVALALVVSGLGHAYLRRWGRALAWYLAVTVSLVLVIPDATVERLIAGDPPPIADIAPAVLVVAASVIDAYVLALRDNREQERDRRADPETTSAQFNSGTATEKPDSGASAGGTKTGTSTDRSERSGTDDGTDPDMVSCPHCDRETDAAFDFCQWCAEPVDE